MHPSVHAAWHAFSRPFEGYVKSMYLDVYGYVTTAVGVLIDTPEEAAKLPWKLPNGELAPASQVKAEWHALKSRQELRKLKYTYAEPVTTVRLTDADIDAIVEAKLASNERELVKWFPNFADMPADGQLGILSIAWAVGPAFAKKFPNFTRSALAGKWWECAVSGKIREENDAGEPNHGVVPRNAANKLCFENAANVVANNEDPRVLHWPNKYVPGLVAAVSNPPGTIAEAFRAATEAKFSALDDLRADAHRQMMGADDPNGLSDPDDDEKTVNDRPRRA